MRLFSVALVLWLKVTLAPLARVIAVGILATVPSSEPPLTSGRAGVRIGGRGERQRAGARLDQRAAGDLVGDGRGAVTQIVGAPTRVTVLGVESPCGPKVRPPAPRCRE